MAKIAPQTPDGSRPVNAHIVLFEPLIPGNAGSLARLCAGTHAVLHLVHPLGFELDDKHLKRAGLDYWPNVMWQEHQSMEAAIKEVPRESLFFFTAGATQRYTHAKLVNEPWLIFGKETTGLSPEIREAYADRMFRVPVTDHIRSINLANVATAVLYESLRQQDFPFIDAE